MPLNFFVKDQLDRIDRKILALEGCTDMHANDFHQLKDSFLDFCTTCYHLKDVLIETKSCSKKDLEEFIKSSKYLSRCSYFANKAKHLVLNEERKFNFQTVGEVVIPVRMSENPWENKLELTVPIKGRTLEMNCLEFTNEASEEWNKLLALLE